MRKLLFTFFFLSLTSLSSGQMQKDPATWAYSSKKISEGNYALFFRCKIEKPWHIYSQVQTKDFIGTKTAFKFDKVSGITLVGKVLEQGKKVRFENKEVGIVNYEYSGTIIFLQKVIISSGVRAVTGSVTYQTCTHERCLPETTLKFSIPVK